MGKYIDKDALVAEIERRIKAIPRGETDKRLKAVYGNEAFVLNDLLSFIDTPEVKEVDLDKELKDWMRDNTDSADFFDLPSLVKHFFELGMAVSNKTQKGV